MGAMPKGDEAPSKGFPSFVGYPIRGSLSISHTRRKQASSAIPSVLFKEQFLPSEASSC